MQKERETYEVIVEDGRLVYKQSKMPVATTEGSKWIFVLSTSRVLYVGQVNVRHRKPAFGTSACMYVVSMCLISSYVLPWAEEEGEVPALEFLIWGSNDIRRKIGGSRRGAKGRHVL